MEEDKLGVKTFRDLGICEKLVEACESLGWKNPTKIQAEAIPHGLNGKDLIALSQTGSGKTGAFVLPILQALLECRQQFFACVLSPTRELAVQIAEQFQALGSGIGIKCVVLVGEEDIMEQYINLAKLPHVIVGTPGRLADHLFNTKGFSFSGLKYLVLDEADRLLNEEFEKSIGEILDVVPHERRTYLFSATMTRKVKKLQKVCLRNPVKIEVASKYSTVDTLEQHYCLMPPKYKDCYLVHILVDKYGFSDEMCRFSAMVFTQTGDATRFVALFLRNLKLKAISISGKMTQSKRLEALNQFKEREFNILICTNVASRGLDIPAVDVVINYDIPAHPKDYIHRVGRTARAGRQGVAISLLNQFELKSYLDIENRLGMKFTELPLKEEEVLQQWMDDVTEAKRISRRRINESGWNKGKKRERDNADADIKK